MGEQHPVYHHGLKKITLQIVHVGEKNDFHFAQTILVLETNVITKKNLKILT